MFGKFLTNPDCMKVLNWLCEHSDREYSAAIVGVECDISTPEYLDIGKFMAILTILEGVGFIKIVNSLGEEDGDLIIQLDTESSITQLLLHLKDEFNDIAFREEAVSPALAYLTSTKARNIVDSELLKAVDIEDILDVCENYKDLDLEDENNKKIFDLCSKLDKDGELDSFVAHLKEMKEK